MNPFRPVFFALIFSCIPLGCMGRKQSASANSQPVFTELISGNYSGIEESTFLSLTDAEEFGNLWSRIFSGNHPLPELPKVDFHKNIVIGLFMGTFSTGGYSVSVEKADETKDELKILYRFDSPGKEDMVTMAVSQPFQLLVIPRTSKRISFERIETPSK